MWQTKYFVSPDIYSPREVNGAKKKNMDRKLTATQQLLRTTNVCTVCRIATHCAIVFCKQSDDKNNNIILI